MKIDWNQKYNTIATYIILTVIIILLILFSFINFGTVTAFLKQLNGIMSPVYLGIIFAYIFNPILKMCEKDIFRFKVTTKQQKSLKRVLSLCLTYIIVLIVVTILILLIFPQIYMSFNDLKSKMGGYITTTITWIDNFLTRSDYPGSDLDTLNEIYNKIFELIDVDTLVNKLQELITNSSAVIKDFIPQVFTYFSGIANGFFNILLGIFFSLYFLASKEKLTAQVKKLMNAFTSQKAYNNVLELANFTDKTFGGYINGKILDSLIIGVLCFIICAITKMPYALLVSTFIAITNVIPVVGPFIGAIPGTFIIFIVDPRKAFWFIIINIILQQVDGNIICPKILGQSTGLSSVWVLFSITVMGGLWGLVGMLISVPIFAILYSIIKISVEKRLAKRELPVDTSDYYDSESKQYLTETEKQSFASRISKLAAGITKINFSERLKKFKLKRKKKKSDKTDSDDENITK